MSSCCRRCLMSLCLSLRSFFSHKPHHQKAAPPHHQTALCLRATSVLHKFLIASISSRSVAFLFSASLPLQSHIPARRLAPQMPAEPVLSVLFIIGCAQSLLIREPQARRDHFELGLVQLVTTCPGLFPHDSGLERAL